MSEQSTGHAYHDDLLGAAHRAWQKRDGRHKLNQLLADTDVVYVEIDGQRSPVTVFRVSLERTDRVVARYAAGIHHYLTGAIVSRANTRAWYEPQLLAVIDSLEQRVQRDAWRALLRDVREQRLHVRGVENVFTFQHVLLPEADGCAFLRIGFLDRAFWLAMVLMDADT